MGVAIGITCTIEIKKIKLTSAIDSLGIIAYAINVEKIKLTSAIESLFAAACTINIDEVILIQAINSIKRTNKISFTPVIKFILALTIIAQIKI